MPAGIFKGSGFDPRLAVDLGGLTTLTRAVIKIQSVRSRLEGDIGYVRISSFSEQRALKPTSVPV